MNPVLFISHGAPNILLRNTEHRAFLSDLGRSLPHPDAVIVLSAHWNAGKPLVGSALEPATLHDFSGFPAELGQHRYAAPGDPALAARVCRHLNRHGVNAECDPLRGLDHGTWTTLSLMYPEADVRVVPVAMPFRWPPSALLHLGHLLGELRDEKIMMIASGGMVHNLAHLARPDTPPEHWASAFATWMLDALTTNRRDGLDDYRRTAPFADIAHPSDEHLRPLFVAWGAGRGAADVLYDGFDYGNLGMHAVAFWD